MIAEPPSFWDAVTLARINPRAGVDFARRVAPAWDRAQCLAWIAYTIVLAPVPRLIAESARAAALGRDDFQRIAVLAWPLFAALGRGFDDLAEQIHATAVAGLPAVTPLGSRAVATKLLFRGALAARRPRRFTEPLLDVLRATCPPDHGRQSALTYRCIADILAERDGGSAMRFCRSMAEGKTRALCLRDRGRGRRRGELPLIW